MNDTAEYLGLEQSCITPGRWLIEGRNVVREARNSWTIDGRGAYRTLADCREAIYLGSDRRQPEEPRWRETPVGATCRDCGGIGWQSCVCPTAAPDTRWAIYSPNGTLFAGPFSERRYAESTLAFHLSSLSDPSRYAAEVRPYVDPTFSA